MNPIARLSVLVLPLVGLAGAWIWTHARARQGVEWEVPVNSSGPRASLRGRYLAFRYDWPLAEAIDLTAEQALCLEGTPPVIYKVEAISPSTGTCRSLVRAGEWDTSRTGLQNGILYVPQEQVPGIRKQLADPGLTPVVRIRVNDSGAIIPLGIEFRPKP